MNLIPWRQKESPRETRELAPLQQFHSELDRLIGQFFRDPWAGFGEAFAPLAEWRPSLDLSETEKEITVRAEVPGVEPKDLNLTLQNNVLYVEGEKKESSETDEGNVHRTECRYGKFQRAVALPAPVNEESVSAEHSKGVLTVKLQKLSATPRRKIEVKPS